MPRVSWHFHVVNAPYPKHDGYLIYNYRHINMEDSLMFLSLIFSGFMLVLTATPAMAETPSEQHASFEATPYSEQKVVFDFISMTRKRFMRRCIGYVHS